MPPLDEAIKVLEFPRQKRKPFRSVADFFANDRLDVVGFTLASAGLKISDYERSLYDEGKFISENEFLSNCSIITSVSELLTCVKQTDFNSSNIDRGTAIDPFVDGQAQNRITQYIQLLLSSNEKSKSSIISDSNSIYKKRYGEDKVFEQGDLWL